MKKFFYLCGLYIYLLFLFPVLLHNSFNFYKIAENFSYLFSSFSECCFVFLFFHILFSSGKHIKILKTLYFFALIFLSAVYIVQGITFYLTGSLLPAIALENIHEYQYHFTKFNGLILSTIFILSAVNFYILYHLIKIKTSAKTSIISFIFFLAACLFFAVPTVREHAPAVSLISTASKIYLSEYILQNRQLHLGEFLKDKKNKQYPFLKDYAYNNDTHFETPQKPNVIIIFMEGISAKFLGCYGGEFENLTPHIDRFSEHPNVCKFNNYFNHTAATVRGIIGTLSSVYPLCAGNENEAAIKYSSLPKLLKNYGFKPVMFSPHFHKNPFNDMLKMLGFEEVFYAEKNCELFLKSGKYTDDISLSDKGIFLSLKQYLADNENDNETKKFICLYNVGSHAFRDVLPDGKKYKDGKNQVLNRIHNLDYEIGQFLKYFLTSPYAQNTYLVITTDHCTFHENDYKALFGNEEIYCFMDKIPLLIYCPVKCLPKIFDTNFRTSLDFAPTFLNLLNMKNVQNSFLGDSLFSQPSPRKNLYMGFYDSLSLEAVVQIKGRLYRHNNVPSEYAKEMKSYLNLINIQHHYERKNKLFPY